LTTKISLRNDLLGFSNATLAVDHIAAAADAHDVTALTDHCDAVADLWIKDGKVLDQVNDAMTLDKPSHLRAWMFDLMQRLFVQGLALSQSDARRAVAI
jgi:hypothetical protein